jgi:glucose-6-phosphate 1-dehydrogenase
VTAAVLSTSVAPPPAAAAARVHASAGAVFDLVIFGGTGDLASRKLLPALFHCFCDGEMSAESRIIGAALSDLPAVAYVERARAAVERAYPPRPGDRPLLERFAACVHYQRVDAGADHGWAELAAQLRSVPDRVRIYYLAVAPALITPICDRLASHGLVDERARVVIEKPVGCDLASAAAINAAVGRVFAEQHTFRIDHYLGKETVQNLTALRFGNALFEPLWNSSHIDHVQITVAETVGVEWRAQYYDSAGALRDMVQNHLLQLLCLVALEPPASLHPDALRDEKLKVLRALKPITAAEIATTTVRGQYRAGSAEGQPVRGYPEDVGREHSATDTFVALRTEVANWRWAGVPFYLRTGKRLAARVSEIVVTFRDIPCSIFHGSAGPVVANKLVLRLQPDEAVKLWLMLKAPGSGGMRLRCVPLDMSFAETFGGRHPDAYERLLMDVAAGNPSLFMRRDEVEAAWRWVDPILEAWKRDEELPRPYVAGTWGPSAAIALIERDGRTWHEEPWS